MPRLCYSDTYISTVVLHIINHSLSQVYWSIICRFYALFAHYSVHTVVKDLSRVQADCLDNMQKRRVALQKTSAFSKQGWGKSRSNTDQSLTFIHWLLLVPFPVCLGASHGASSVSESPKCALQESMESCTSEKCFV